MVIELLLFLIGLILGSFGNNVISHFVNGHPFDFGRSHCFCKERKLKLFELLPLISYLFLKGKCSQCDNRISFRYFLVEGLSGILTVLVYLKFQFSILFLLYYSVFYIMLLIAVIDFLKFIIPNILLLFLFVIATFNLALFQDQIVLKVISSVGLALLFISINIYYSRTHSIDAIGYGDIKYLGIISLLFAFPISLLGLWLSALIALPSFYLMKYLRPDYKDQDKLPFGTFISLGYFISLAGNNWLINTYNQLFMGN